MKMKTNTGGLSLRRNSAGFSLLELMIIVAVIGVLAGVAYPSYQEQGRRAKRAEARNGLLNAAARLERLYSDKNRYWRNSTDDGPLTDFVAATSESGKYTISYTSASPNQLFTLTATPSGFTDATCSTLTLSNTGQQGATGTGTVEDCWTR